MGVQVNELAVKQLWEKQFIDFTFKGISATSLGMVAVIDGDRNSRNLTSEFEDEVSEVKGVNGQYYWGTRYKIRERNYTLATDGITEQLLRSIKAWLRPGEYGKLEEYSNLGRHCFCRVSKPPEFKFIPFEKKITVNYMGVEQEISVTEYKGELTVTFIQDNPFYYSNYHLLSEINPEDYPIDEDKLNLLKAHIAWNNNIPSSNLEDDNTYIVGNDSDEVWHSITSNNALKIYNPSDLPSEADLKLKFKLSTTFDITRYVSLGTDEIDLEGLSYFNPSAPTGVFINFIPNDYAKIAGLKYNKICAKNKDNVMLSEYRYGLPGVYLAANLAIEIARKFYVDGKDSASDLLQQIKEEVINDKVVNWCAYIIAAGTLYDGFVEDGMFKNKSELDSGYFRPMILKNNVVLKFANWFTFFNLMMLGMFCYYDNVGGAYTIGNPSITSDDTYKFRKWYDDDDIVTSYSFSTILRLNGITSRSTVGYTYNEVVETVVNSLPSFSLQKIEVSEENCGDIMYSEYPKMEGNNFIDTNGIIKDYSLLEFYNGDSLYDSEKLEVQINYDYKYL